MIELIAVGVVLLIIGRRVWLIAQEHRRFKTRCAEIEAESDADARLISKARERLPPPPAVPPACACSSCKFYNVHNQE